MKQGARKNRAANVTIGNGHCDRDLRQDEDSTECPKGGERESSELHSQKIPDLHKKLEELTRQLEQVAKQRDDLEKDVETLCMQSSSSIFDGSMVLSERVFQAERELSIARSQLSAAVEERDNLREDLRGHRDSKRAVEISWKSERSRAEKLEKELQFYQEQSARAMSDRNRAVWEAEELRKNNLELEDRMNQAESRAEAALAEQADLDTQLSEAKDQIKDLGIKAHDCEKIPGLWRHIEEASNEIEDLRSSKDNLERKLKGGEKELANLAEELSNARHQAAGREQELQEARKKSAADTRSAASRIKMLEGRVAELEESNVSLEIRVEEAEGHLAASQVEVEAATEDRDHQLSVLEAKHSEQLASMQDSTQAELEVAQKRLAAAESKLRSVSEEFAQVSGEKMQALMRASQAEQTAEQAFEETGSLLNQIADLKDRVGQATQEKVAALLQVASLKEHALKSPPQVTVKPTGWRLWGSATSSEENAKGDHSDSPEKVGFAGQNLYL